MAKKESKKKKKDKPSVSPDLEGLNIEIDSFGEIRTNYNIDKINAFLNKNVEDKKLVERKDYDKEKGKEKKSKKGDKGKNEEE